MSTGESELVAMLRDTARTLGQRGNFLDAGTADAAACEIERLRAEVEQLRARAERASAVRSGLAAILDDLGHDARAASRYRLRDVVREAFAGLDAAPTGKGGTT